MDPVLTHTQMQATRICKTVARPLVDFLQHIVRRHGNLGASITY
jgi:hypothetical protein